MADKLPSRSGRGNVFLDSALPLVKALQRDIAALGRQLEDVAIFQESQQQVNGKSKRRQEASAQESSEVIRDVKSLLDRIDREIPLLQLAITASGESLSTSLPPAISPSRLLQASTLLTVGDTHFAQNPTSPIQIGPAFNLSLYMLFIGHATASQQVDGSGASTKQQMKYGLSEGDPKPQWQEVLHKARVRLCRTPYRPSDALNQAPEYAYHLDIVEDLDDGRFHAESAESSSHDGVLSAGIKETIAVSQLSKIFYTDSGKLLNIGNDVNGGNNPILLIKRDIGPQSDAPQAGDSTNLTIKNSQMHQLADNVPDEQSQIDQQIFGETLTKDHQSIRNHVDGQRRLKLPQYLDPAWMALEMFDEDEDDDQEDSDDGDADKGHEPAAPNQAQITFSSSSPKRNSMDAELESQVRNLSLEASRSAGNSPFASPVAKRSIDPGPANKEDFVTRSPFGSIVTSLSLIEMLIRLASLQEFQQASHLSIPDHIMTYFLEETSNTVGVSGGLPHMSRSTPSP